ncbi:MAG TPA: serine O-acetyltransferase EpsC [Planctomycetota bacterium]|nr:serine O-acetyltransferase EpsC [Planctomycetota bacterium]
MREELRRLGELPGITSAILQTYTEQAAINHIGVVPLPSKGEAIRILDILFEILYPGYFGEQGLDESNVTYVVGHRVNELYDLLTEQVYRAIKHECRRLGSVCTHCKVRSEDVAVDFLRSLPAVRELLAEGVQAAYDGDPAAKSTGEVIFSYPATVAITTYRLAHQLLALGVPLLPRIMSERAHSATGIDIHPGAQIGRRFFIDHGTGVVIGETTVIGDDCKLYQGVTLGAMSFPKDERGQLIRGRKRHPTLEDRVTVYAGATILGGDTVVGHDSVVGGNVWLTDSVPPHSKVVIENPKLIYQDAQKTP